jgi:hypothetical protein
MTARLTRLCEYLAAQSFKLGTQEAIIGGGADVKYDWRRLSTHTVDKTAAKWTTAGTNIYSDLDAARDLIVDDSYLIDQDYVCLVAYDVAPGIFSNTRILADIEKRRDAAVQFKGSYPVAMPDMVTRLQQYGARPLGYVTTDKGNKFWFMVYDRWYHDASGTKTYYLPSGDVIIFSPSFRGDRAFGPSDFGFKTENDVQDMREIFGIDINNPAQYTPDISANFVRDAIYMDAWRSPDKKIVNVAMQMAPVFIPYNVNGIVYYHDCA